MADEQSTEIKETDDDIGEAALVKQELSALVSDFRHLAKAEIEYLKVRAAYSGRLAKWISIYVVLALFGLLSALIGLVVGLLAITADSFGTVPATVIVVGTFLLFAVVSAFLARRYARKLTFDKAHEDD